MEDMTEDRAQDKLGNHDNGRPSTRCPLGETGGYKKCLMIVL